MHFVYIDGHFLFNSGLAKTGENFIEVLLNLCQLHYRVKYREVTLEEYETIDELLLLIVLGKFIHGYRNQYHHYTKSILRMEE